MHYRNRSRSCSIKYTLETRNLRESFFADKEERVLSVPPGNVVNVPNPASHRIDNQVSTPAELVCPVVRPLLVQMPCPALEWDSRREEDYWPELRERLHERLGVLREEMLRDLQRNHQVKLTLNWKRF